MKTINAINAIKFNEDNIYAFRANIIPAKQYHKKYGFNSIRTAFILNAGRTGINADKNGDYNDFRAMSISHGEQNIFTFTSFSTFLTTLNTHNIQLFVFETIAEFAVWVLTNAIVMEDASAKEVHSYMKKQMPSTLGQIAKIQRAKHYDYKSEIDNTKKYGCDECGWVYNDTIQNKSFHVLGKFFVCPECGANKAYFTKLN